MTVLWVTRGFDWGSRFVWDGGLSDPLQLFEQGFVGVSGGREGVAVSPTIRAARFQDPLGRRDRSGRPILHEFVVSHEAGLQFATLTEAVEVLWPLAADEYETAWAETPAPRSSVGPASI